MTNLAATNDNTRKLEATLWQEQPKGRLKPLEYAGRFLFDTEKWYAITKSQILVVVWGL